MTPEQRRLRAQIAANARWSRYMAREDQSDISRSVMRARLERAVDPQGRPNPAERAKLVKAAARRLSAQLNAAKARQTRHWRKVSRPGGRSRVARVSSSRRPPDSFVWLRLYQEQMHGLVLVEPPRTATNRTRPRLRKISPTWAFAVGAGDGIEPALSAWEAPYYCYATYWKKSSICKHFGGSRARPSVSFLEKMVENLGCLRSVDGSGC